jgi:hypothetical protein
MAFGVVPAVTQLRVEPLLLVEIILKSTKHQEKREREERVRERERRSAHNLALRVGATRGGCVMQGSSAEAIIFWVGGRVPLRWDVGRAPTARDPSRRACRYLRTRALFFDQFHSRVFF